MVASAVRQLTQAPLPLRPIADRARSVSARWLAGFAVLSFAVSASAQPFQLPTANRALFEPGNEEKFFAGTAGKPWTSGCFGCVRSDGWQMHEGLDIRFLRSDRRGEPTDTVMAAAGGTVVYFNKKPGLSNYGNYVVVRHRVDGVEIYSLYAHLREIAPGLKIGQEIKTGDTLGIMGRTSNTGEISKDRAHVHFELNLFLNDRFPAWFRKTSPKERNDHREWNGQNMAGLDPRAILLAGRERAKPFNLLEFVRNQTPLCRVLVRKTDFPWLKRYAALVRANPKAEKEGIAGYEIALNFNGVPFELIPRAASEFKEKFKGSYQLLSVNEAEQQDHPCRRLVAQRNGRWELTAKGVGLLDLLVY